MSATPFTPDIRPATPSLSMDVDWPEVAAYFSDELPGENMPFADPSLEAVRQAYRRLGVSAMRSSHLQAENARLHYEATHDNLTGTLNRGGFFAGAIGLIDHAPFGSKLVEYFFDLDDFKAINDTYGHEKGDEVLQTTAALLKETFAGAAVGRIGGDEFVVLSLLSPQGAKSFEKIADETLKMLRKAGAQQGISYSVGRSSVFTKEGLRSPQEIVDQLTREGDAAMYAIKQTKPHARRRR